MGGCQPMTVDCHCDDGCDDYGICPDCLGLGWYIVHHPIEQWIDAAETN